jgi:hypothetical protein
MLIVKADDADSHHKALNGYSCDTDSLGWPIKNSGHKFYIRD